MALNCAAIPSGLLESELFGHERGAFTGAVAQTMGAFKRRTAERCFWMKSEIFLSSCNRNFFALFRKRSSNAWEAAGPFEVDVRVIAATNQDLWGMVQERKFRADLYYRLNVFPITLPPLREREDDIPLLIEHFVQMFANAPRQVDRAHPR